MDNPWVIGAISWFLPGAGHFFAGKVNRGLLIGGVIWIMFIVGFVSGGSYYPAFNFKDGALLHVLNVLATAGHGLGFLVIQFFKMSPPADVASWATFEYGGRFLEMAGLLNYLSTIDAFDIAAGRKE